LGARTFCVGHGGCLGYRSLVDLLVERFEPLPIVSPWNRGAGFFPLGSARSACAQLAQVRNSDDPRLRSLREGVETADRVVEAGRARGWASAKDGFWDDKRKDDVLSLCRSEFPETAVAWLDAAAALGQDGETAVNRLLGTGGNFGRQDLSATYLARVLSVLHSQRSADWLRAALLGTEDVPYLRDVVGQFDPGRAGGIQSSPWEKADAAASSTRGHFC
jgi:CRISPR-associated protein Csx17